MRCAQLIPASTPLRPPDGTPKRKVVTVGRIAHVALAARTWHHETYWGGKSAQQRNPMLEALVAQDEPAAYAQASGEDEFEL